MGLKLERFELLSKMQSENMKFFSDASYEVQSADFKIKTAHLAKIVSVLFQYLKPEIEDYIKEKEEEVSVEVNSSSECLGVPGTDDEGAGNVPASSQDVSISAQPGRDSHHHLHFMRNCAIAWLQSSSTTAMGESESQTSAAVLPSSQRRIPLVSYQASSPTLV